MTINVAFSALFTWLVFGGAAMADRGDVVADFVPQTFMISLMGSLVPAALTRKQIRRGAIAADAAAAPPRPRNLMLRSLLAAALATLVIGGIAAALVTVVAEPQIAFTP